MILHPALPHLPEVRRQLIGFGALCRGQAGVKLGHYVGAHGRDLAAQAGFLSAQLRDLRGIVRADSLEHRLVHLPQLLADRLRLLADALKFSFGLRNLRRRQIQVLGDARCALVAPHGRLSRLSRLGARLWRGKQHASGNRRSRCNS